MHVPPCAFAIAAAMDKPSPTPPSARARASSARPKRSKIRSSACGGYAAAAVGDLDRERLTVRDRAQLDRVALFGVLHGVLDQRVEGDAQRLLVGGELPAGDRSEPPGARGDLGPAHEHILQEGLDIHLTGREEVRPVRLGEQEEAGDDPLDAVELIERDRDFG